MKLNKLNFHIAAGVMLFLAAAVRRMNLSNPFATRWQRELTLAATGILLMFAITPSISAQQQGNFTVLHNFTGPPSDGRNPATGLTIDSSGNLYGTTSGTAFMVRPDGTEIVLHNFAGGATDAANPNGLTLGADGNFYGSASGGGASGKGLVFSMTPEGVVTILYSFKGSPTDGSFPESAPIRDAAGNLYGTTRDGGAFPCYGGGCGTVYKLSPDGTETVLHNFAGAPNDGANPQSGSLIQDSAGNFYATTLNGGTSDLGTVFRLSPDGTETVLYSFVGPANNGGTSTGPPNDGAGPIGGVIMDAAGNLYGTTLNGGAYSGGTLFKLSPAGAETLPHSFGGTSDGRSPYAGLVMDSAGNLYGTLSGAVFELSPGGTYTVLHNFSGSEGGNTFAGLVQDGARNLYGTTYGDGSSPCSVEGPGRCGIVFKVRPPTADLIIHSLAPTLIPSGATLTYTIIVNNSGPDAANDVSIQDAIPAGTTFNSVSVSAGSCTAPAAGDTGTVTCTASSLANNGVITEVLTVNVTAAMGSAVMDTATVSSSTYDPFPGNNSAEFTTTVI
jgi:uncharacterized repeat protein (TIGR01451 family)